MKERPALDWKAIGFFVVLAVVLASGWARFASSHGWLKNPQSLGIMASVAQLSVLVSALLTMGLFSRHSFRQVGWRIGPSTVYLATLGIVAALVAAVSGIAFVLGFVRATALAGFKPGQLMTSIPILLVFTCVFSFAEEFGWRGFLLPKLLPLGVKRALLASGFCWFLWEAPLVCFGLLDATLLPVNAPVTLLCHFLQTIAIGVIFGYLRLRYDSVFLPAFAHGVLNTMGGLAVVFLAESNPLWGDFGGPIGTVAVLGLATGIWWQLNDPPIGRFVSLQNTSP